MIILNLKKMKYDRFGYIENIYNDGKLNELEMQKKFKSHNIIKERVELYKDFTINLLQYIYDTYFGKEYIKTKKDIEGHFNWCFGKVLEEFYDEEISFYENDELYDYFYGYYLDQFYSKEPEPLSYYEKFWESIFEIKKIMKNNVFEVLVEIYEIFDKSITNKEIKIFETQILI
jgi:hypothetical protein